MLPLQSVGVQGDYRTYAHPAMVWGDTNWKTLEAVSTRVTNEVPEVNRVIHLIVPDQPPDLRLKRSFLTRDRLDLLREADAIAMRAIAKAGLDGRADDERDRVSQMPTVLLPLTTDGQSEIIVLRPVTTPDFMTARFAELPRELVQGMAERILSLPGIGAVLYDVTHKPPGTVEWE